MDYKTLFGRRWLSDDVRKSSAIVPQIYNNMKISQTLYNSKLFLSFMTGDKFLLQTN